MDALFAIPVEEYRRTVDCKTKAMIDVAWPVWSGAFDEEIAELAQQELQNSAPGFVWHAYLEEKSQGVGAKYRAFLTACTGGPIVAEAEVDAKLGMVGVSELGEEQKQELAKLQEQLKQFRRKGVKFVTLPSVGGASGAEYTAGQLQGVWDGLSLGHRFARKKTDVRAFILSAELFPPNVVKQGVKARLSDQVACDEVKFKRVVEFCLQKRQKDDIIIVLDGRSRASRRAAETFETKFESGGNHLFVECSLVYEEPSKKEDARTAARAWSYTKNNLEMAILSLPNKGAGARKVLHRSEFNACGESTTADTTYSGVPMRRFCELPRMTHETKTSILGAASCASVDASGKFLRLQADIEAKGFPFSYNEVKPISLWQTLMEHHKVTHIVDFTPGSGALAVAAAGATEYEGVAANDAHREWLDSVLDRCVMYKAGHEEGYAEQLGGDADFVEKASKYFSGTMLEAKRMLMPVADGDGDGEEEEEDEVDEEE